MLMEMARWWGISTLYTIIDPHLNLSKKPLQITLQFTTPVLKLKFQAVLLLICLTQNQQRSFPLIFQSLFATIKLYYYYCQ